jgi:hypothetical protein|tara:strand:- start:712 stop:981 length:270 start_codon:yes stop_codon:yes gene_type:complete
MSKRIEAIAGEEYTKTYQKGWRASRNIQSDGALDRNGGDDAWLDGYMDEACGWAKWHTVTHWELGTCSNCGLSKCDGCDWNKEVCECGK